MSAQTGAIVIGGGIAGLATAALLAREGYEVTLVEARSTVGGRAGTFSSEGFRFDTGPSWYLMPEVFDHFYRLLGTSSAQQLKLQKLDPGYRVYFEGQPDHLDIVADREANLDAFEAIEPGARVTIGEYLDSARDTYQVALRRFLYTTFQSIRSFAAPEVIRRSGRLIRLLTQPLDRFIASRVKEPRLRQVLGYPAVFLGSSPSLTPSMYHLMSYLDLEDGVLYPDGGLAEVIESIARLARDNGVRIITDARVTEILTGEGRHPEVHGVRYTDAEGRTQTINADIVVSAADLHHTETTLLPAHLQTYPERWWQKRISGPSAVLVLLGVSGELPQLAHHTLFFTTDWDANFTKIFATPTSVPDPASIYVCRPSASDDSVAPEGTENLFVLIPVPADPEIGGGGPAGEGAERVERAADSAIAQVGEWAGIPNLADRIILRRTIGPADFENDYASWKGGALGPAHTLRQSAFLRGKNISSHVRGLYYAGGTTVPGIGLPMCLISAELVVKRLRGDTRSTPLPEPL